MKNQFQQGHIDHRQIAALLTQSTHHLDEDVVSALGKTRALALQKQRVHAPAFSLSTIGHRAHSLLPHSTQQWVAAAVVFAAVILGVATYWPNNQDHQNLDLAILTSDLPIDEFVDK